MRFSPAWITPNTRCSQYFVRNSLTVRSANAGSSIDIACNGGSEPLSDPCRIVIVAVTVGSGNQKQWSFSSLLVTYHLFLWAEWTDSGHRRSGHRQIVLPGGTVLIVHFELLHLDSRWCLGVAALTNRCVLLILLHRCQSMLGEQHSKASGSIAIGTSHVHQEHLCSSLCHPGSSQPKSSRL